jgi:DNA primase
MSRFTPAFLDELRARVTLSSLIGRTVKLTKAGREYKGCCPVHSEKTPSFTVNDEKAFGHCFGCGWHCDAIRFLMDTQGRTFVEAVEELAGEAGMELPAPSPEAARAAERIVGVRAAIDAAQALYARELAGSAEAQNWLAARGIDRDTAQAFELGWAPAARHHLRDIGIALGDAVAAGLAWDREGEQGCTFHLRVMVPVHDARGRLIAFGGRSLRPSAMVPKYKNSPDGALFDKGRTLFNLHRLRALLQEKARFSNLILRTRGLSPGQTVVVEGYMDAIALHRCGIAAGAPMGTALTEAQLELLWRSDQSPLLLFDGDAAGFAAAERAAERALPLLGPGRSLRIGRMPEGIDPDDLVRESVKAGEDPAMALAAWLAAHPPVGVVDALFDAVAAQVPRPRNPEVTAAAWARLERQAERIGNETFRREVLAHWRGRFDAELSIAPKVRPMLPDVTAEDEEAAEARASGRLEADPDGGAAIDSESAEKLRQVAHYVLSKRADRRDINDELKNALAIAKALGFTPKVINAVVRQMEEDPAVRETYEAELACYRTALGVRGPMTAAMLPAIGAEQITKAAKIADKRMARTMALIDARDVAA